MKILLCLLFVLNALPAQQESSSTSASESPVTSKQELERSRSGRAWRIASRLDRSATRKSAKTGEAEGSKVAGVDEASSEREKAHAKKRSRKRRRSGRSWPNSRGRLSYRRTRAAK